MPTTYAIPNGRTVFDATLWTGDGATSPRSITNTVGFKPDLVWSKDRTSAYNHQLFDSVRGTGSSKNLMSNSTDAEGVNASSFGYLSAFNSNGFALTKGSDPGNEYLWVGKTSDNYVAWQWQAGGTAVSNTSGTITSSVSANTTAGFSIVSYTGNGATTQTVGHGIGVAPQMVIVKERADNGYNWPVYHISLSSGYAVFLNTTGAQDNSTVYWGSVPTTTVFGVNYSGALTNQSGKAYIAYCWAPVAGYSAFGSYTGNGSADGPFIYTGFRPRFIMIKDANNSAGPWVMYDTSRSPYNQMVNVFRANTSDAEGVYSASDGYNIDALSNGFKVYSTWNGINNSGDTTIYMAFAENPFKYANAR